METRPPAVAATFAGDPPVVGEHEGYDVYPMPTFVRFAVPDTERTAQWYVDALGFGVMFVGPEINGQPMMIHLRRRKYQDVLLVAGPPEGGAINWDATGELDALATRAMAVSPHDGVRETPWGTTELHISDPHGHRLVFFAAPARRSDSIDEAMEAAAEKIRH